MLFIFYKGRPTCSVTTQYKTSNTSIVHSSSISTSADSTIWLNHLGRHLQAGPETIKSRIAAYYNCKDNYLDA